MEPFWYNAFNMGTAGEKILWHKQLDTEIDQIEVDRNGQTMNWRNKNTSRKTAWRFALLKDNTHLQSMFKTLCKNRQDISQPPCDNPECRCT